MSTDPDRASGNLDTLVHKQELSCRYGGDSCSDSGDCCSGSCEEGVCAQRTCQEQNDCAIGGTAEGFECSGGGYCVEQCVTSADCRHEGWVCTQGGRCVDGEGNASATVALQADLDELPDAVGLAVPYTLPVNAQLKIDDPDGDGVGVIVGEYGEGRRAVLFDGNGSGIRVAKDVVALQLRPSASYSKIEDMRFDPVASLRNDPHAAVGIDVRAHGVRIDNLFVSRLGTGIRAVSGLDLNGDGDTDDADEYANVDAQQWSAIRFDNCYHNAIYMDGADANAGTLTGIEILGGAGLEDGSEFGNTYVGLSAEGTHDTSVTLSGAAQASVVIGGYVERGDAKAQSASEGTLWAGGNAVSYLDGPSERVGYSNAMLRFKDPSGLTVTIPGGPNSAFRFQHPNESKDWGLVYEDSWKAWMFAYGSNPTDGWVYGWTGDGHASGPANELAPGTAGTP